MLYLIDSSIYVFRAWQSLPPSIVNRHGEQANAVHGFADMLCALLAAEQPRYVCCAFDESFRQSDRHALHPDYKANRPPAPKELHLQFKRCQQVARAMGVTTQASSRVEADDIIGLYAADARSEGEAVCIVSGDKDLVQFVGEADLYWDPGRRKKENYTACGKRFKLQPKQIPDMLALAGDVSDNIPGIPGLGMATAQRLLRKWGNLNTLYDHLHEVPDMHFRGAQRIAQLLADFRDQVFLARQLTGLMIDPDLPRGLQRLRWQRANEQEITCALCDAGLSDQHAQRVSATIALR